jgi:hypothetical protein
MEGAVEKYGSVFGDPVEEQVNPVPCVVLVHLLGVIEQVDFDLVVVPHPEKDRGIVSACSSFVLFERRNSWADKSSFNLSLIFILESSMIWDCQLFLTNGVIE